ncbi:MAG: pyridoxal-phosphate dependent enzyme [Anaerolineales bacterium]|nr:pyridoxal-phosphate dependent enzyme [Anaerolineales bacterium]
MIPEAWLAEARGRIEEHIRNTPLTYDAARNLYIKWENHQVTGSFKARGALNKTLNLLDWEREMGLVTASAGNHGQGVALAGKLVGAPVTVFASKDAPAVKLEAMRALGADLQLVDGGYHEAEEAGLTFARRNQAAWISPYNDGHVIAGQSTLVPEIIEQNPQSEDAVWIVPVSGGGLLAGIGAALSQLEVSPRLVGVQAEAAAFMHGLFYRNSQEGVQDLPSLADGLAGAVEADSITVPLVKKYADEILLFSEEEIGQAVAFAWREYGERIEGSAAVGLAAILTERVASRPAVVVISGGNIQPEVHAEICERYEV